MRNLVITILVAAAMSAVTGCAATAASSGSRSYEPHTMNAVVGVSMNRPETGVAVGANYEYRKDDKLGFGEFADIAFGDDTSTVVGGAVFWHPEDRWAVFGGPGVNFASGGSTEVIARVVSEGFGLLDAPPQRLNAKDTPVPYHPSLIEEVER